MKIVRDRKGSEEGGRRSFLPVVCVVLFVVAVTVGAVLTEL
jgi:hypothetical protein